MPNQGEMSALVKDHGGKSFGDKKAKTLTEQIGLHRRWFDLPLGTSLKREDWGAEHPALSPSDSVQPLLLDVQYPLPAGLTPIAVWEHPDALPEGEFIKVPRLNVHLSAGHGNGEQLEIDLERADPQIFRAEWVRKERLKPGALSSMYARGNSMEPRIYDGDALLVDTSQTTILDGRVYAIWYAGELRVKRLYKRPDGGLLIHSDNERDYPRFDAPPEQMEHIRIIGRVVHIQGTGGL